MQEGKTRYIVVVTNAKRERADVVEFWNVRAFKEWCFANVASLLEHSPFQGLLLNGDWFVAIKGKGAEIQPDGKVNLV